MATETPTHLTPADIQSTLAALQGEVQGHVDEAKPKLAAVAAGGAIALMLIFFLLGKRSGKKKSAIVEIRRV